MTTDELRWLMREYGSDLGPLELTQAEFEHVKRVCEENGEYVGSGRGPFVFLGREIQIVRSGGPASSIEQRQAAMDARVEDVAHTMHFIESGRSPSVYFGAGYAYPWETEHWGAVKATRNRARELIDLFDARAAMSRFE